MRNLQSHDKLLLATLLPIWLAGFALHLREVVRTGYVAPPVIASPQSPTTRPWGQRTAYVRDPDGNLIELAQDLPSLND